MLVVHPAERAFSPPVLRSVVTYCSAVASAPKETKRKENGKMVNRKIAM